MWILHNISLFQYPGYYFFYTIQFIPFWWSNFSVFIFFLPIAFENILTITLVTRNVRLILALAISIGVPMAVMNETRSTTTCTWQKKQRFVSTIKYCNISIFSLPLISAIKNLVFLWFYWVWITENYLIGDKFNLCHTHIVYSYFTSKNNPELLCHSFQNHMV